MRDAKLPGFGDLGIVPVAAGILTAQVDYRFDSRNFLYSAISAAVGCAER